MHLPVGLDPGFVPGSFFVGAASGPCVTHLLAHAGNARPEIRMSFTLATWNINSVRLREGLVAKLMEEQAPDILCLQECKSPVGKIPTRMRDFAELGYRRGWTWSRRGQKGYNGVAILSKLPIEDAGELDFAALGQARHVAARLEDGTLIHNFYVPAGGDVPDRDRNEKFAPEARLPDRDAGWLHRERPESGDPRGGPEHRPARG